MNLRQLIVAYAIIVSRAGAADAADRCGGALETREARADAIKAFVEQRGKKVLTFAGFSGAGYEDADVL